MNRILLFQKMSPVNALVNKNGRKQRVDLFLMTGVIPGEVAGIAITAIQMKQAPVTQRL